MSAHGYILLIESDPDQAAALASLLEQSHPAAPDDELPYACHRAADAVAAGRMLKAKPDCRALLIHALDGDAAAAVDAVRQWVGDIPVIVLLDREDPRAGLDAVRAGAQDYLVLGSFDHGGLSRALYYATQRKAVESALVENALTDRLTGLPKRRLLLDRLEVAMKRCTRDGSSGALLFIDLTGLQQVNESLGYRLGNEALKAMATRLLGVVRSSDSVARIGGNRFVVLLPKESGLLEALAIGEKVIAALREPLPVGSEMIQLTVDIGVVRFKDASLSPELLVQLAHDTMRAAGKDARGRVRLL